MAWVTGSFPNLFLMRCRIVVVIALFDRNVNTLRIARLAWRLRASVTWLVWHAFCSNWKSNFARNSCQQACFGVGFGWVRKWLTAGYLFSQGTWTPTSSVSMSSRNESSSTTLSLGRWTFAQLLILHWEKSYCKKVTPSHLRVTSCQKLSESTVPKRRVVAGDSLLEDMKTLLIGV